MKSERVLVVDDEPALLRAMQVNLEARGYECLVATDGESALRAVAREHPDIVILDLGLPGIDGFDVLAGIRGWTSVPVIVLSARDAEPSKVNALDAGADDYVTKPFGMDELFARLRAALRRRDERAGAEEPAIVVTPEFVVDLGTRRVSRQGQYVHLTPVLTKKRTICGCTSATSDKSWNRNRRTLGTSLPRSAWDTDSNRAVNRLVRLGAWCRPAPRNRPANAHPTSLRPSVR